jgi:transcriptional regulator with XRE-family HTH domain
MNDDASFGHWVMRRRKALHFTRAGLAQRVGCAEITLRKIEADERRPSEQIAERLAECLRRTPKDRAQGSRPSASINPAASFACASRPRIAPSSSAPRAGMHVLTGCRTPRRWRRWAATDCPACSDDSGIACHTR